MKSFIGCIFWQNLTAAFLFTWLAGFTRLKLHLVCSTCTAKASYTGKLICQCFVLKLLQAGTFFGCIENFSNLRFAIFLDEIFLNCRSILHERLMINSIMSAMRLITLVIYVSVISNLCV